MPSRQTCGSTPSQVNLRGLSTAPTEAVKSGDSDSGTAVSMRYPTRIIVTREHVTPQVQKVEHVSSTNVPLPGTSNLSEDITDSMPRKDVNDETDAPVAVSGDHRTTNIPPWKKVMLNLPFVSFIWYPVFLLRKFHC